MEQFTDIDFDGKTIVLELFSNKITIGNHFEYNLRILLNSSPEENQKKICKALNFFRNTAILVDRVIFKEEWLNFLKMDL